MGRGRRGLLALSLLFAALAAPTSSFADPSPSVTITSGISLMPVGNTGETFFARAIGVTYASGTITLAGSPDGATHSYVDDFLEIRVTHADGSTSPAFSFDYSHNCTGAALEAPIDLTSYFETGSNTVHVTMKDKCGGNKGTNGMWLVGLSAPSIFDDFDDNITNIDLWGAGAYGTGASISETNRRVEVSIAANASGPNGMGGTYDGICALRGDLDIQVDYQLLDWPSSNGVRLDLGIHDGSGSAARIARTSWGNPPDPQTSPREVYENGFSTKAGTSHLFGTLRLVRTGSTVKSYYASSGSWNLLQTASIFTADAKFYLRVATGQPYFAGKAVKAAFDNFAVSKGELVCPNRPPRIDPLDDITAEIGDYIYLGVHAYDPDGDEVTIDAEGEPSGTFNGNRLAWIIQENDAGFSYNITFTADDGRGGRDTEEMAIHVQFLHQPTLQIAAGDSIAAGTSLDEAEDYVDGILLGGCGRSDSGEEYGSTVFNRIRSSAPAVIRSSLSYQLRGCIGYTTDDFMWRDTPEGETQLEALVRQNPGLITLTLGANDLNFTDPENLIDDPSLVPQLIAGTRDRLSGILSTLVNLTDSKVIVTTYHNPSAEDPRGVGSCPRACFREFSENISHALGDAIKVTVHGLPVDRVRVADPHSRFKGHEASLLSAGHAIARDDFRTDVYCAHPASALTEVFKDAWISSDCAHPNERGHREYADAVMEVWTNSSWTLGW